MQPRLSANRSPHTILVILKIVIVIYLSDLSSSEGKQLLMILQALTRNNRLQQSCNNQTKTIKKLHTKSHAIVLPAHNYI